MTSVASSSTELPNGLKEALIRAMLVELSVFEAEHWPRKGRLQHLAINHLKLTQNLPKIEPARRICENSKTSIT